MILVSPIFWGFHCKFGVTFTAVCSGLPTASWRIPNPATHLLASVGLWNCGAEPYGSLKPSSFHACSISTMCALPQSPSTGLEQSLVCLDCGCLCFLVLTLGSSLDGSFWGTGNPFSGLLSLALSFQMQLYSQKMEPLMVWILCSRFCSSCSSEGNQVCLPLPGLFNNGRYFASGCALLIQNFKAVYISLLTKLHTFKKSFCSTFFLLSLWIWRRAVNRNHDTTWLWCGLETFSVNQISQVSLASCKFSGHGRTEPYSLPKHHTKNA